MRANWRGRHSPAVRAAVEAALLDLTGIRAGRPVHRLLGLPEAPVAATARTIGITSPLDAAAQARAHGVRVRDPQGEGGAARPGGGRRAAAGRPGRRARRPPAARPERTPGRPARRRRCCRVSPSSVSRPSSSLSPRRSRRAGRAGRALAPAGDRRRGRRRSGGRTPARRTRPRRQRQARQVRRCAGRAAYRGDGRGQRHRADAGLSHRQQPGSRARGASRRDGPLGGPRRPSAARPRPVDRHRRRGRVRTDERAARAGRGAASRARGAPGGGGRAR